jgi:hypothetical protein
MSVISSSMTVLLVITNLKELKYHVIRFSFWGLGNSKMVCIAAASKISS